MEEQIVSFETAKLAKEKGFAGVCSYYYTDDFQNFKSDGILKVFRFDDSDNVRVPRKVNYKSQPHLCVQHLLNLYSKNG